MNKNFDKCLSMLLVHEGGMKQLTNADVEPIYRKLYWLKTHCQELPSGVDWAVFDYAVSAGPSRAAKALQRAVGLFEGQRCP